MNISENFGYSAAFRWVHRPSFSHKMRSGHLPVAEMTAARRGGRFLGKPVAEGDAAERSIATTPRSRQLSE
jgi:hypothetical protein